MENNKGFTFNLNKPAESGDNKHTFSFGKPVSTGFAFKTGTTGTGFSFKVGSPAGFSKPQNPSSGFSFSAGNSTGFSFFKSLPAQASTAQPAPPQPAPATEEPDEKESTIAAAVPLEECMGEDNEENLFAEECKAFIYINGYFKDEENGKEVYRNEWELIHKGRVRVNIPKEDADESIVPRIIFRREKTYKVDINACIPENIVIKKFERKGKVIGYSLVLINAARKTENADCYLITFNVDKDEKACDSFYEAILKAASKSKPAKQEEKKEEKLEEKDTKKVEEEKKEEPEEKKVTEEKK